MLFVFRDASELSFFLVNLAFALALRKNEKTNVPLRVGLLDLDIFGPSIPTLMGLQNAGEPALSSGPLLSLSSLLFF